MQFTEEQIIDILLIAYTLHSLSNKLHDNENFKAVVDSALIELERMCENHGLKLYRDCDSITYKKSNTYYLKKKKKIYCVNTLENQCMDSIRKMLGLVLH